MAKKTDDVKDEASISDLELRIASMEDLVSKLIAKAHICRNCKRYDKGICTGTNKPTDDYNECNWFDRYQELITEDQILEEYLNGSPTFFEDCLVIRDHQTSRLLPFGMNYGQGIVHEVMQLV